MILWTNWAQLGGSFILCRFSLQQQSTGAWPGWNGQDGSLTCLVSWQGWLGGWAQWGCLVNWDPSPGGLNTFLYEACLCGLSRGLSM